MTDEFAEAIDLTFKTYSDAGRNDSLRAMQAEGLDVYVPKDNELQLDLDDNGPALERHNMAWELFKRRWPEAERLITPSKSGRGTHVRVLVPGQHYGDTERILFQAILGSDNLREFFNLWRADSGVAPACALVELPIHRTAIQDFGCYPEELL